jgi:hypothetical protein
MSLGQTTGRSSGRGALFTLTAIAVMAVSALSFAASADAPPAAPSPDPHNISGTWFGTGFYEPGNRVFRPLEGGDPPFTDKGKAIFATRREIDKEGHPLHTPAYACAPSGFLGAHNGAPFDIIQTPGQITFVYEGNHDEAIVRMDQDHPKKLVPTFNGDAVGHWDGDTLVIDTVGLRGDRWLDYQGTPAGDKLHVIERVKKINDGKTLDYVMTIDDPEMYTKPWSFHRIFLWKPQERVGEEICEEDLDIVEPDARHPAN